MKITTWFYLVFFLLLASFVQAQPVVNLGGDTTVCGNSLTLDAGNTGAAFLWSTGAITQTITVTTSGIYWVDVTDFSGTSRDSIEVVVVNPPTFISTSPDTSICRGLYQLNASSSAGLIEWTDSMGNVLGYGDSILYDVQDTSVVYYQAKLYETSGITIGLPNTTPATGFINIDRGVAFNTTELIVLNSVYLNVDNAAFSGTILLKDSVGNTIASHVVTAPGQVGLYKVTLDFQIPAGNNYGLLMTNITVGNAQFNAPTNWNLYDYGFLELEGLAPFVNVYGYFYDWKVSRLGDCASSLDSVLINRLETPVVNLGADTSLCSSSLTLDATNLGANFDYIWSTGASSPTITVTVTDRYKVTVTYNGNCPVEDSLDLLVFARPVLTQRPLDVDVCEGTHTLTASSSVGVVQWLDSLGNIITLGDTLAYDVQDTVRLWYQAVNYEESPVDIGLPTTTLATGFVNLDRGIAFNLTEPIVLNSVYLNVDNAAFSGTILLKDSVGNTIASHVVTAPGQVGLYKVTLDFQIPAGNNYGLLMTNITVGNAQFNAPTNWNLYDYGFLELEGLAPFVNVYGYFYDWKVSRLGDCASSLDSVLINRLETPVVHLPIDTLVCNDTLMLDVFNVGASYNWGSTGVTTSNITITQEGNYKVTASIGTCSDSDSIDVYLTPIPTMTLLSTDTTTCAGEIPRLATGADFIKWYTEPVGGNYLGNGSSFMYNAQVSDTIWCLGQDFSNKTYVQGLVDTFVATRSDYYYPVETRGLLFDVQEDILLKDVTMYINQTSFIGTIELWDSNDVVLSSQPIVLTNLGKNIVPLGFYIPVGANYKLMLTDYNTVPVLSELPYTGFPIIGDFLTIKSGIQFPLVYQYFYNWNVQILSCPAERLPSIVEVLPTPDIDFPTDSVICGDTLILDASGLGLQSYLWSTGETTASIILDSTTKIYLLGTIGICSDEDSMNVFIVEPPSLIIPPNDTTVCQGNITLYASGNAAYYAWYDSATSATPFSLGDSVLVNLQDTTTLWVEGIGFIPKTTSIGAQYDPNSNLNVWGEPQNSVYPTRGMAFNVNSPILLNSVAIYVDTATTATLTIYKTGFPYYTKQLNLANAGENIVQIDTLLEGGSYSIELGNKLAGKILFLSPYTNLAQLNTNTEVTFTGSIPLASQYLYFFNWKISTPSCATDRLPVHVTVPPSPQISLVADTATCTLASITLDPILNNNPAYTYLWSDASTDDTLSVSSSGYYKVTVTNDGVCSSTQDVYVQFLSTPNDPNISNFGICAPQNIAISIPANDGIVVWYDSSDLNTVNYLTAPYNVYVGDTTDFWIDVAPKATTRIGKQVYGNPNEASAYLNFIIPNRFDVHEYAVLDSVAIYVETVPATLSIVLMDSAGHSMNTLNYTVTKAKEKVFIPLDFLVPPGANYQLSFSSINSLFLVDRTPIAVPSSSANIATLTGTIFSDYSYFFDWHFSYAYPDCHSNGDTFTVSVTIPVDIPDSIYTCDSIKIDATHPNIISYNWSNGLTTGLATFYDAGTYVLTITDGAACTVVDTVTITKPMPVGLPLGNAACDFQLATNYNQNNASFSWSTGDTTDVITIPNTGIYSVTVTTNEGCVLADTVFISQIVSPPMPNLGNFVSACYTDTLDAGYGGQGMAYLWNTGAISQQIIVNTSGVYSVTVTHPLGCSGADFVSITIDTAPKAAFTITKSNRTVLMNNLSTGANQATDYFWEMGDGTTYQIPNPFHTYIDSGCYIIRLTVTDACGSDSDTLRVAVDVPDSICTISVNTIASSLEGVNWSIVPNPNTGRFQLQLSESLKAQTIVQLYDLNGRVVHEQELPLSAQTNWEIQTKNLPTGVYFLRLLNDKQSETHRVLILRD
jgi:PKD repeat protein